jgi:hypothetical protein
VREFAGGARGDIGPTDKEGTDEWKDCDSGKYFSGARTARVGWFSIAGITPIFEIDCLTILAEDVFKSARRTGAGLCGREISGTLVPTKSKNSGRTRAIKRRHLIFLKSRPICIKNISFFELIQSVFIYPILSWWRFRRMIHSNRIANGEKTNSHDSRLYNSRVTITIHAKLANAGIR